jgi:aminoacrylate hydrolase
MGQSAVLLICGLGGRARFWDRQVAALAPRFAPLAYDLKARSSVDELAQDALDLLDERGIPDCHIVGHSTGGAIAQVLAADHPERVRSVVLSATWCAPTPPFAALFRLRKRVLAELGPQDAATLGALFAWPDDWLATHPELLGAHDPADTPGLAARMDAILAFDRSAELGAIRAPTLVLCAEDDRLVPLSHSRRIAAGIPGAELRVLPRGGHFPQAVDPHTYNSTLLEFLENADER